MWNSAATFLRIWTLWLLEDLNAAWIGVDFAHLAFRLHLADIGEIALAWEALHLAALLALGLFTLSIPTDLLLAAHARLSGERADGQLGIGNGQRHWPCGSSEKSYTAISWANHSVGSIGSASPISSSKRSSASSISSSLLIAFML